MFEFCLTAAIFFMLMGVLFHCVSFVFSILALPVLLMPESGLKAIAALTLIMGVMGTLVWLGFHVWPGVALMVHTVLLQINGG